MGERMADEGGLLFGRRTYAGLLGYWNRQDSPFKDALNNAPKYVASGTLREPLPWPNSTLLEGDAADAVAELKKQAGNDLAIMGSGKLIWSLMPRGLIDEYLLMIHPLVLGSGRRLFPDDGIAHSLRLVDSKTTTTGVLIATYQFSDLTPRDSAAPTLRPHRATLTNAGRGPSRSAGLGIRARRSSRTIFDARRVQRSEGNR
jgi:dihydrofolate reductase